MMEPSEFAALDKNNDGKISREEARAHALLNQQFDQVDNDNDGEVTREEVSRHPVNRSAGSAATSTAGQSGTAAGSATGGAPPTATVATTTIILVEEPDFLRLDSDRDGRLSRGEVREVKQLQENWELADRDSDGYLTREEIRAHETRLSQSGSAAGQQASGQGGTAGAGGAVTGLDRQPAAGQTSGSTGSGATELGEGALMMEPSEFAALDKNNDGQISREEARPHALLNQQFDQVDNDNDGQVTREEVKKHPINRPGGPANDPSSRGGSASGAQKPR